MNECNKPLPIASPGADAASAAAAAGRGARVVSFVSFFSIGDAVVVVVGGGVAAVCRRHRDSTRGARFIVTPLEQENAMLCTCRAFPSPFEVPCDLSACVAPT